MPPCLAALWFPNMEALPLPEERRGLENNSELGTSRFCFTLETHLSSSGILTYVV